MTDKYTYHYFGFNTRGDSARAMLAHGKVQYKDNRFGMDAWPAIKPTLPGGVCPCLELEDGTKIG